MQIAFRHMEPSEAVTARIRKEVDKLHEFFPRITSCRVVVEAPHRHHKWGELFHVRIELGVPGNVIVVSNEPSSHAHLSHDEESALKKHIEIHPEHKDINVAIRDAFSSARRQLQDYVRRLRGDVKSHLPAEDKGVA